MASEIDARLSRFGPRDLTVLGTNGLLRVLPHGAALPPVTSLAEVAASLVGGEHHGLLARADALAASESGRKAMWLVTGIDAGDGLATAFATTRTAITLYMQRKSGRDTPISWSTNQAADAVLKAIGIAYLLDLCFPQSDDPVRRLAELPSGRAMLAYFAATEVALPFVEVLADRDHTLSHILPDHLDQQTRKLATVAGAPPIAAARRHLSSLVPTVDALVAESAAYLAPFVQTAEDSLSGTGRVMETVGDVVALGSDVLPVYRFLGVRLVAEAAVARAAAEAGLSLTDSAPEWGARFIDAPRQAVEAQAAPSETPAPTRPSPLLDGDAPGTGPSPAFAEAAAGSSAPAAGGAGPPPLPPSHAAGRPMVPGPSEPVAMSVAPPSAVSAGAVPPAAPALMPAPPPRTEPPQPTPLPTPSLRVEPPQPAPGSHPAPRAVPSSPPMPKPPPVEPTVEQSGPPPSAPTPGAPAAPSRAATVPPILRAPDTPSAGEPPGPNTGRKVSWTAIAVALALVLLLACGGVLGLTGVGAVFFGAHQETTQGEQTAPAAKRSNRSGSKSQKGRKKGATNQKKGKSAGKKKSTGKKRTSGGSASGKRR